MTRPLTLAELKEAALASLYEHLLTADAGAYWYLLEDIREQIAPPPSGAMLHIALESLRDDDGLVSITYEGGVDDLFTLTAGGIQAAERIHGKFYSSPQDVVIVSDQRQRVDAIRAALDNIENELRESNELASQLDDGEKDLIEGEVAAAKLLVRRDKFRLSRLMALIAPMLKFLADKFAGSAIGEVAKQLMKLLIG